MLYYLGTGIILLDALIGGIAYFAGKLQKNLLPIALAATCSIADECLAHYFKIRFKNNLVIYFFGNTFEYTFFAWFLYLNINNNIVRKSIAASIFVIIIFTLLYGYTFAKLAYSDPYTAIIVHNYGLVLSGLLLTIWSIFFFKWIFDSISQYQPLNVYVLLVAAGMLFYYAFSTLFFCAETYLVNQAIKDNPNFFTDIYKINLAAFSHAYSQLKNIRVFLYLTNILLYLCIFVVLLSSFFPLKKRTIGF